MAKPDGRLYGLAVYLAFWLDREDLADAVEDYAEYLENPDGRCYRESPEEFGRDLRQSRLRRRPAWRAMAAAGAAALLIAALALFGRAGTMAQKIWAMTALAAGVPFAMWALLGGRVAAAVSPQAAGRRTPVTALGGALAAVLIVQLWLLLTGGTLLTGVPPYLAGAVANLALALAQGAVLIVFVLAAVRAIRRSVYYVCLQAQALALWTLLRGAYYLLHDMSPEVRQAVPSLLPFAAGWSASLVLWCILRRLAGKEADRGRADEEGRA
ncbi:MAG: hypothetical protein HFF17_10570 [Oscillospiraceae bacterium]|nr:hypothetical protein [Oscillospiraceae bacterium]